MNNQLSSQWLYQKQILQSFYKIGTIWNNIYSSYFRNNKSLTMVCTRKIEPLNWNYSIGGMFSFSRKSCLVKQNDSLFVKHFETNAKSEATIWNLYLIFDKFIFDIWQELLRQLSYAMKTQLKAPIFLFFDPHLAFMA